MESSKLGRKIRDWAINLGFRLPDGSTPSSDYFAMLTATPHRRHLWGTVIETVLERQKVEHMRKQILVAELQGRKKFPKKNYSKQITDRIELWHKQNAMETEMKEKKNSVIKMEGNILAKASDLVFEICKLAELEKRFEELKDKFLILKLFSRRRKKLCEELEGDMLKVKGFPKLEGRLESPQENSDFIKNMLLSEEKCKCTSTEYHSCNLLKKIEQLCQSGISEQYLWEEVNKYKKSLLQDFSEFLIHLNTIEKNILNEKASEIERNVNRLVTQLKQKMTATSLQVMLNSVKGRLLESELEKLERRILDKELSDGNSNEDTSFLSCGMNESHGENENNHKNLKTYLTIMGLESYREFLKEELGQFKEEELMTGRKYSPGEEQEVRQIQSAFEALVNEIRSYKLEGVEVGREIHRHHDKLETLLHSLKEETEIMVETNAVAEAAKKLKTASEKQVDMFLEIPLDAFRTLETPSGRVMFECESEAHCLENYGGEFKQLFSTLLIPPLADLKKIISKLQNKKRIINEVKKFMSNRDQLVSLEKKIQNQVSSIKYDLKFCEKNFNDSESILWNTFSRINHLFGEIDFLEKVLKNWLEQPYRSMLPDSIQGKSLKDFEKQYRNEKNKQ